jgi:hypothetical protein
MPARCAAQAVVATVVAPSSLRANDDRQVTAADLADIFRGGQVLDLGLAQPYDDLASDDADCGRSRAMVADDLRISFRDRGVHASAALSEPPAPGCNMGFEADISRMARQPAVLCRLILAFPTRCDIIVIDIRTNVRFFGEVARWAEESRMACGSSGPVMLSSRSGDAGFWRGHGLG